MNVNLNLMEDQLSKNDKCRCECKKPLYVKMIMFGILLHVL